MNGSSAKKMFTAQRLMTPARMLFGHTATSMFPSACARIPLSVGAWPVRLQSQADKARQSPCPGAAAGPECRSRSARRDVGCERYALFARSYDTDSRALPPGILTLRQIDVEPPVDELRMQQAATEPVVARVQVLYVHVDVRVEAVQERRAQQVLRLCRGTARRRAQSSAVAGPRDLARGARREIVEL